MPAEITRRREVSDQVVLDVDGTGQITNGDDVAALLLQVRAAQTSLMTAGKTYVYGIKVLLSNGLADSLENGMFVLDPEIVQATS